MITETVGMKGKLKIEVFDGLTKQIRDTILVDNLVVQRGKEFMASRMKDGTFNVMSDMAIGFGTVTAVSTDTALGNEATRSPLISTTVSSNVITFVATFDEGFGTGPITEAGIFNAAIDGDMLARTVFPVVNKGDFDTITITWAITVQ